MNAIRVLVIDDEKSTSDLLALDMLQGGVRVVTERATSPGQIEEALQWFEPDLVLSEFELPELDGMQALEIVHRLRPGVPFVFVSNAGGEQQELEALRQGALDFVPRDDRVRLLSAVRHALNEAFERRARKQAELALQESEIRFRLFMEHLPGAVYMKDLEGRFTYINAFAKNAMGRPASQIIGQTLEQLYPPDVAKSLGANDQRALSVRQPVEVMEEVDTPDGPRTFLSIKFPVIGANGQPAMVGGFSVDITQRTLEQRQMTRLGRIHTLLAGINNAIVHAHDRDTLLEAACRLAVEAGGYRMAWIGLADPGKIKVTPVASHGHDDGYLDEVARLMDATAEERHLTGWSVHIGSWDSGVAAEATRQSEVIVCEDIETDPRVVFKQPALSRGFRAMAALPLTMESEAIGVMVMFASEPGSFAEEDVGLLTALASNISVALDHLNKAQQLAFASWHDSLTALPNRALFVDRVSQMLRDDVEAKRGVSLLVFDLKRFRDVNEMLGRDGADQALKTFASRLNGVFSHAGTVARAGGDVFAVALRELNTGVLATLGDERWDGSLVAPMTINGVEIRVPFKLGISSAPADGDSAEVLFLHAEAALQRAKEAKDTCVFYSPELNTLAASRLSLEMRLRKAVETRQFLLHYLPRIDLPTRRIVGLEALIRWRDSDRRLVPPDEFIPALEETGLIDEVGRWAIEQAVSDIRWWQTCGLETPRVSLNISPVQLRQTDFVGKVLAAAGGPLNAAAHIDLEIKETAMQDIASVGDKLRQLRDLGVGIIMDDFGTGHSSLSQLVRLPVNLVKIDRSFVHAMDDSPAALAIISAIVGLAQSLGIVALAEGIQTEKAARDLQELGCQQGQGFYFGEPRGARDLAKSLQPIQGSADALQPGVYR